MPTVWLSGAGITWEGAAKEYLASIEDRIALDENTRDLAKQKSGELKKTEEKVLALAAFVQKEITYKAIEFGRRARIPDKPTVVIRNRYGDCKDHALLLRQLLQCSGIPAYLALVNTNGEVRKDLPSLDQFNHMVVFVPSLGKGTFIDCTDKDSALGTNVPSGLAKKEALILDEKKPRLVEIPDYAQDSNDIAITRKIEVAATADALAKEDVVLKGFPASWYRNFFRRNEPANRKRALQDDLSGCAPALEVLELGLEGVDDARAPLAIHVSYRIRGRFHSMDNQMVGQLPAVWERMFLAMETVENRRSPFRLYSPMNVESHVTVALPQGYQGTAIEPVQLNSPFAQFSAASKPEAHFLTMDYKVYRPAGSYPAAQYDACQEILRRVMGALEQNIVFKQDH